MPIKEYRKLVVKAVSYHSDDPNTLLTLLTEARSDGVTPNLGKNPLVKTLFSMERGALLAFYHGEVSSRSMIGKLNLIFC